MIGWLMGGVIWIIGALFWFMNSNFHPELSSFFIPFNLIMGIIWFAIAGITMENRR